MDDNTGFVGRHLGLSKVRGRFTGVEGIVTIGDTPTDSRVEVTIDMTTVSLSTVDVTEDRRRQIRQRAVAPRNTKPRKERRHQRHVA